MRQMQLIGVAERSVEIEQQGSGMTRDHRRPTRTNEGEIRKSFGKGTGLTPGLTSDSGLLFDKRAGLGQGTKVSSPCRFGGS